MIENATGILAGTQIIKGGTMTQKNIAQQSSKRTDRKTIRRFQVNVTVAVIIAVVLAVLAGVAIAQQDKYTLKVPGGLAFSEFRGYEGWQAISLSRSESVLAMTLGNPVMIDAYRAGIPANGKPLPDGA